MLPSGIRIPIVLKATTIRAKAEEVAMAAILAAWALMAGALAWSLGSHAPGRLMPVPIRLR